MEYNLMRLKKYYDVYKSNVSFSKTSYEQKKNIILNIIEYLKISKKKLFILNKPLIAQIEPTSLCNLKCSMCIREKIGVPIGSMSFENFKIILDKLDSLFKIHLSGQGEPLINPEIFKMIEYANNKGVTVFFTTNGTFLTDKNIKKIVELDIGEIGVSIDSIYKKEYENIRKGSNFEELLKKIRNLVSALKKNEKKTILSTSAVISKNNIEEIPKFVGLAHELGIKKIGFQTMQEKEDYIKKYDEKIKEKIITSNSEELFNKIKEAKKISKMHGITLIFDQEKSPGCIWPWRSIYITWNGYVTPCCKILDYRKPYFGNILKDNFWDIWNGSMYQNYRRLLRGRESPLGCRGCDRV